jgi:hypothetical protein
MFGIRPIGQRPPPSSAQQPLPNDGGAGLPSVPPAHTAFEDLPSAPPRPGAKRTKPLSEMERRQRLEKSLEGWIKQGDRKARSYAGERIRASFASGAPLSLSALNARAGQGLPIALGLLGKVKELRLDQNGLTEADFRPSIRDLISLEDLSIAYNRLESIPEPLLALPKLRYLCINFNAVDRLSGIARCGKLEWLKAEHNQLRVLPEELARLEKLSILCVGNNKLHELPKSIGLAQTLCVIDASDNRIGQLPESIYALNPSRLRLILDDNPLSVATLCQLLEWHPPDTAARAEALARLAVTLALPVNAPALSDLGSLTDMRLNPLGPDTLLRIESHFLEGDARRDMVKERLSVLAPAPEVARLRSMAKEALGGAAHCVHLAVESPTRTPRVIRDELLASFSSYELLQGQCRVALHMKADDPAAAALEKMTLATLEKLGAGALSSFAPGAWRAYFGTRHADPLVQSGHYVTAWLKEHAAIADHPLFGKRGCLFESAQVRGRLMKELNKLLDELNRESLEPPVFDLGFEREPGLTQRALEVVSLGARKAHKAAHEREPVPTVFPEQDVPSVKLLSQRPISER